MLYRFYSNSKKNRVTVVGSCNNGYLKLAAARCSNKDQFVRRKGRAIAEGRLLKGKLFTSIPMVEENCSTELFIEHAKLVVDMVSKTKKVWTPE